MSHRGLGFQAMAALMLLAFGAAAQPMPDCRQAKTSAEQAICGSSELAATDKAMAEAYAGSRAQLSSEQQKALRGGMAYQ